MGHLWSCTGVKAQSFWVRKPAIPVTSVVSPQPPNYSAFPSPNRQGAMRNSVSAFRVPSNPLVG